MFTKPNLEALKNVANELRENSGGPRRRYLKLESGTTKVLICPPYNARGVLSKAVYFHYQLPGEEGKKTAIMDPTLTLGRDDVPNPVGKAVATLLSAGRKEAEVWRSSGRGMVNVIPVELNGEAVDRGKYPYLPHILEGAMGLHGFLSSRSIDPDFQSESGFLIFADPTGPQQPLKVTKTGSGKNTEYKYDFVPKTLRLGSSDEELETISKEMYDLDKIYTWDLRQHQRSITLANKLLVSMGLQPPEPSFWGTLPADLLEASEPGKA